MTKRDKLVDKIRARPAQARFDDVQTLVELFGYRLKSQNGSHARFAKAGARSITIPKVGGQYVLGVYLDQICDLLGLDD